MPGVHVARVVQQERRPTPVPNAQSDPAPSTFAERGKNGKVHTSSRFASSPTKENSLSNSSASSATSPHHPLPKQTRIMAQDIEMVS